MGWATTERSLGIQFGGVLAAVRRVREECERARDAQKNAAEEVQFAAGQIGRSIAIGAYASFVNAAEFAGSAFAEQNNQDQLNDINFAVKGVQPGTEGGPDVVIPGGGG